MPTDLSRLIKTLSRADIEHLLAAKDELESLESRRQELLKELAAVESRLAKLAGRALGQPPRTTAKKTARKAVKKTAKKRAKKSAKRAAKAAPKRSAKTKAKAEPKAKPQAATRGRARGKATLEDVVVQVLTRHGDTMSFKDLLSTITTKKLFKTRSKAFDNVLRRTLSTSERVKRVGRGLYGL
ncbi:MAG: HTH domain-containing protein [Candidatus Krumholzibacteriia bacterium]